MAEIYEDGFTRLQAVNDEEEKTFNIIFIHGLRGHPRKTWEGQTNIAPDETGKKSRSTFFQSFRKPRAPSDETGIPDKSPPEVFWPQELLAVDFPQAKVWTYGYKADVIGMFQANNKNSISAHGRDLGHAIRRDIDENPILFVVHSLGGIILKDAFHESEKCQKQTRLILFLGTPHRGSQTASMGQMAAKLARLALQDANTDILRTLEIDSEILERVHRWFRDFVQERKIAVHSFQEAKGMTGVKGLSGKVVDDFSSKLDIPSETVESIDADHRQMVRCSRREDVVYRKIAGELKSRLRDGILMESASLSPNVQQLVPDPCATQRYFQMPFTLNKSFVGRELELRDLEDRLLIRQECGRLAIVGLGGVGKTQLARSFCHHVERCYTEFSIFWVSATSVAAFTKGYGGVARTVCLPSVNETKQLLSSVRTYLESAVAGKWLLIVDNADDTEILQEGKGIIEYLPHSDSGLILFTTRYKDLVDLADHKYVELGKMDQKDAELLLEEFLHGDLLQDKVQVRELLEELVYLPLAIVQAISYIIKKSTTIAEYLGMMKDTRGDAIKLLSRDFKDNTRDGNSHNAVAVTWLVSFAQIRKDNPRAAEILYFLAFIEAKEIPLSILPSTGSQEERTDAIGTLVGYSFLTIQSKEGQEDNKFYDMHRLVQLATRIWIQKQDAFDRLAGQAVHHLYYLFPQNGWNDSALWEVCIPHIIRIVQETESMGIEWEMAASRSELCSMLGVMLALEGRSSEAIKLTSQGVAWTEHMLPEDDERSLTAKFYLAATYRNAGKSQEAVALLKTLIAIQAKRNVSEIDSALLLLEHELAITYLGIGEFGYSLTLLEKVISNNSKTLHVPDMNGLAFVRSLAHAYLYNEQPGKAIETLKKMAVIEESVLPENHLDRQYTQCLLGTAYRCNGQREDAIKILESVCDAQARSLRENHPHQLFSQHELAVAYLENQQLSLGLELIKHVVTIRKTANAESDRPRLHSERELARAWLLSGQPEEAIKILERVIEVATEIHQDKQYFFSAAKDLLEMAYRSRGQVENALKLSGKEG